MAIQNATVQEEVFKRDSYAGTLLLNNTTLVVPEKVSTN
jgi:hypothetical protein